MLTAVPVFSTQTVQFLVIGCATGALVALVALGVVLVHRASGVVNFSASAVGAIGAFLFYTLRDNQGLNWIAAMIVALVASAALGALLAVIMRMLSKSSTLVKSIATLAFALVAQGLIGIIWNIPKAIPEGLLPTTPISVGSVHTSLDRLILVVAVVVAAVILRTVYTRTLFGLATSAVAENRVVAQTSGWSPNVIEFVNFIAASVLSGIAAIFLAPIVGLNGNVLYLVIIPALAAALLGRFKSFGIAVAGAIVIGALQAEILLFQPNIAEALGVDPMSLAGLPDVVPLLVVIVVTVTGARRLVRGEQATKLPLPGTGKVRLPSLVLSIVAGVLVIMYTPSDWAAAVTTTLAIAIVLLSVVVVTGYAGQLSLCQYALAGLGAWVAARLVAAAGVPFGWAVLIAIVVAVSVGVLVALPALRARGLTLAIATLGLALMINSLIFSNGSLTGGFEGSIIPSLHIFGIDVTPSINPESYGIFVLVLLVIVGLIVANVRRGRAGRRLLAVRNNERAAASLGVGIVGAKLYAFGLAAGIAAIGGIAFAFQSTSITFDGFAANGSLDVVLYAMVGGVGWIAGGVLGAVMVAGGLGAIIATSIFGEVGTVNSWLLLVTGAVLIIQLRMAPNGLVPLHAGQVNWLIDRCGALIRRRVSTGPRKTVAATTSRPAAQTPTRRREPVTMEMRNVTVRFGGVVALDDVSFTVEPGNVVGLIGPNGAGKTTALDVLTGFTRPATGSVLLGSESVSDWSPERRARAGVGRSWQSVELFGDLTIRENLLVAADPHNRVAYLTDLIRPGRQIVSPALERVTAEFELGDILEARPSELPHGMARLVGIARAMVTEPSVLLLDEPAAGLDAHESVELRHAIRRVADGLGIGVLLVEHDVDLLMTATDYIVALDFGRKIAEGTPSVIANHPDVIKAYLGEVPAGFDATTVMPEVAR